MANSRLREKDYFIAWLVFFLGATIGGGVAGLLIGIVLGIVLAVLGVTDPTTLGNAGGVAGFLVSIPVSYLAFRLVVPRFIVKKVR